ncbi:hypothetical protein P5673_001214 [Acropora cervicornis]|uniref:Uncharacterized protein n=1 Tax=Acropora cervicornis TaxID=6130 RepID=A0AAD9R637_ACRCE|nr:hypothetical protein P5673_001214 [Acropora cervicornis]
MASTLRFHMARPRGYGIRKVREHTRWLTMILLTFLWRFCKILGHRSCRGTCPHHFPNRQPRLAGPQGRVHGEPPLVLRSDSFVASTSERAAACLSPSSFSLTIFLYDDSKSLNFLEGTESSLNWNISGADCRVSLRFLISSLQEVVLQDLNSSPSRNRSPSPTHHLVDLALVASNSVTQSVDLTYVGIMRRLKLRIFGVDALKFTFQLISFSSVNWPSG